MKILVESVMTVKAREMEDETRDKIRRRTSNEGVWCVQDVVGKICNKLRSTRNKSRGRIDI